jgi:alpha-tubulin suppressor-like RCC1 family protein
VQLACHSGEPFDLPPRPETGPAAPRSVSLRGAPLAALALGTQYSCALLSGGAVKCWGSDEYGVLGRDGARQDIADPSAIEPIDFGSSRQVLRVTAGWHHACVLFEDGKARCWGRNDQGQLGYGSREDYGDAAEEPLSLQPDLPLAPIIDISAGVSNTCAIVAPERATAGNVHCWGSDSNGGIGDRSSGAFADDEPLTALRPVALDGELARRVVAGDAVSCAMLENGAVRCWGNNTWGTLGTGTPCNIGDERFCEGTTEPRPIREVQGLGERFITSLQLNQAHACALDSSGDLSCWGRNDQSRAGYPEARVGATLLQTPGRVNLDADVQAVEIGLGTRYGCALDARGEVRCWGEAGPQLGYGQAQADGVAGIGGTLEPGEQYAQMPDGGALRLATSAEDGAGSGEGALRVRQLFVGGFHACAILERAGAFGGVRCWGHNEFGELGYGSYERVGNIGDDASPALEYEQRLDHPDVCIVPSSEGPCSRQRD